MISQTTKENLRPILINKKHVAVFHCWGQFGNNEYGMEMMAIIEYPDGKCGYVPSDVIQFTDTEESTN